MQKNEYTDSNKLPTSAILLSIFKTLEVQFQERSFLPNLSKNINPLWLFAEKERDNYLWRKGSSISDEEKFEFWIDIKKLCEKRLKQIELSEEGFEILHTGRVAKNNPDSEQNKEILSKEKEYIETLYSSSSKIEKHASALSHAGLILEKEISNVENKNITFVLLP